MYAQNKCGEEGLNGGGGRGGTAREINVSTKRQVVTCQSGCVGGHSSTEGRVQLVTETMFSSGNSDRHHTQWGLLFGLVGLVSVYCNWARQQLLSQCDQM